MGVEHAGGRGSGRGGGQQQQQQHERREERRAAMLKRQVASLHLSPSMAGREAWEARQRILAAPPDVAPTSSYEELPASRHCYWADPLLLPHVQLQAPPRVSALTTGAGAATAGAPTAQAAAAAGAAAMASAWKRYCATPPGGGRLVPTQLGDVAVDADYAALLANA